MEGMKERGEMIRLDACIKIGHNMAGENYMWSDPKIENFYPNARFLPTVDMTESVGKHFITLVPAEHLIGE